MVLHISSELHRRLLAEAAATPHVEVCGLLIGTDRIERIIPTENVADDPAIAFEINPAALFAAIREDRGGNGRVLGYYHSHPAGPPTPSLRDQAQAMADGRAWIIIGDGQLTAWRLTDANEFRMIELKISD
jgi:desampylase